jgi:hypothetical protein
MVPQISNRRSYEEEIEDDLEAYFDEVDAQETMTTVEGRRIAKLRNSPRKQTIAGTGFYTPAVGSDSDFEEATFLAPMEMDP